MSDLTKMDRVSTAKTLYDYACVVQKQGGAFESVEVASLVNKSWRHFNPNYKKEVKIKSEDETPEQTELEAIKVLLTAAMLGQQLKPCPYAFDDAEKINDIHVWWSQRLGKNVQLGGDSKGEKKDEPEAPSSSSGPSSSKSERKSKKKEVVEPIKELSEADDEDDDDLGFESKKRQKGRD